MARYSQFPQVRDSPLDFLYPEVSDAIPRIARNTN